MSDKQVKAIGKTFDNSTNLSNAPKGKVLSHITNYNLNTSDDIKVALLVAMNTILQQEELLKTTLILRQAVIKNITKRQSKTLGML